MHQNSKHARGADGTHTLLDNPMAGMAAHRHEPNAHTYDGVIANEIDGNCIYRVRADVLATTNSISETRMMRHVRETVSVNKQSNTE